MMAVSLHFWKIALLRVLLSLMVIGALVLPIQQASAAMQPTTQPIVIVVRDGAGNPLVGIPIKILVDVPPVFEDYDQCVTGMDGTCTVRLLPNTYRIQFVQGWRGLPFVSTQEQEAFRLTVTASDQVGYSTFVVAQQDGRLVPVWDMSRDASRPPEPFLPSFTGADPLASLDLGPLMTGVPSAPGASATPQTAVDVVGSGAVATLTPGAAAPSPSPAAASAGGVLRILLIALIALTFLAMVVLLVAVIARSGTARGR